jgi:hypothetical protein
VAFDSEFSAFANYSVNAKASAAPSELDDYLKLPVESVQDPLKWWHAHRRSYPNLSRMVLDYMSIPVSNPFLLYLIVLTKSPAMSTAIERVFLQGRQLLHFTRNALSASSIHAYLCLGSWGRNDLIVVKDLLSVVGSMKRKASMDAELLDGDGTNVL